MNFFRYFPVVPYSFLDGNTTVVLNITNPTVHFKISEQVKSYITVLYDYVIQDGQRPDTVATQVYGSPDYTWVILLINSIITLYDWPLTYDEFNNYIADKYGSVQAAQATPVYKTSDGYYVDQTTFNTLLANNRLQTDAYDDEMTLNEAKRRIKLAPPEFVEPLVLELRQLST